MHFFTQTDHPSTRTVSESSEDTSVQPPSPPTDDLQLPSNTVAITTADGEKVHVTVDEAAEGLEMPVGAGAMGDGENGIAEERAADRRAATNAFYFYQGRSLK